MLTALTLIAALAAGLELWLATRQLACLTRQGADRAIIERTRRAAVIFSAQMALLALAVLFRHDLPDSAVIVPLAVAVGWASSPATMATHVLLWTAAAALLAVWPAAWPLAWPAAVAVLAWRLFAPRRQPVRPLDAPHLSRAIQAVAAPFGLRPVLLVAVGDGPANAGIRGRRLVFQKNLLRLPEAQIVAVAAHELGHRHHRHHEQYLAVQAVLALAVVLGAAALADDAASAHYALALPALARPLGAFVAAPLLNGLRRRFEYQADAVAARRGTAFADALRAIDSSRGVAADALYAIFHQPYPALGQRLARLQDLHST